MPIFANVKKVASINEFNWFFRQPTVHPLVAVGDLSTASLTLFEPMDFGMYCIVLMDESFGELVRNGKSVRYKPGTIFSLRPGQQASMRLDYRVKPRGMMLAFRPELLEKSGLGRDFYMFQFFQQDDVEALELSNTERGIILNGFANISAELQTPTDYMSNHMLRLGIGHLLSYCKRFYERQFRRRTGAGDNLIYRLDTMMENYLSSGLPAQQGPPTVAWCASQFNLTPNYFGDLAKRELHMTAQEYVQGKIITVAQTFLRGTSLSVNEIAEELGFAYPNHFTRLFRRKTGLSPLKYRKQKGNL